VHDLQDELAPPSVKGCWGATEQKTGLRNPAVFSYLETIHALTYIDDETKRRQILNQLNKGEDRHKLARAVFPSKQGELRQRYREGQEDQVGALGLVVNMIVLWNTLYINAALEQLAREGHHLKSEDVARISPLVFEHVNLLGRYAFSVPEAVTRSELRPLRNPADVFEEVA
jgi:Tn3 transposase DDE domain